MRPRIPVWPVVLLAAAFTGCAATPDCRSTFPAVAASTEGPPRWTPYVECKGHPQVLSVVDGRFLPRDEARAACDAEACAWTTYEPRSGSQLKTVFMPPLDRPGRFSEHVETIHFAREGSGGWKLQWTSIRIADGFYFPPPHPAPPESAGR